MRRSGRPVKKINRVVFEKLCSMLCTQKEICEVMGVSEKTLRKFCVKTYRKTFKEAYEILIIPAKIELRKAQWRAALEGDTTMLIWLGMNYLNQTRTPNRHFVNQMETNEKENQPETEII